MPITIQYGSPGIIGAASYGIGRERGKMKAGAQAAKFLMDAQDRKQQAFERQQARNDRLMITDAGMRQQAGLQQQRLGAQAEMQDAATQARAGAARDKMQRDAAEFAANTQIKDRDFELKRRKQEQAELDAWRQRNRHPNPSIGGFVENPNDPRPQFEGLARIGNAAELEGLQSGEYYYTPTQKKEQARLNDLVSIYQGPGDPRFNEPQRQSIIEQIQGRVNGMKPVPVPLDEQPVPLEKQIGAAVVNGEAASDIPLVMGPDGVPQALKNGPQSRTQMALEARNTLKNQMVGLTNAEGKPVYSEDEINRIAENLHPTDLGGQTKNFGNDRNAERLGQFQIAEWKSQGFKPEGEWGPDGYTVFQGKKEPKAKPKEVDPYDEAIPTPKEWMADKANMDAAKDELVKEGKLTEDPKLNDVKQRAFDNYEAHKAYLESKRDAAKAKRQQAEQEMMTTAAGLAVSGADTGMASNPQAVAQQLSQIPQGVGGDVSPEGQELAQITQKAETDLSKMSDDELKRWAELKQLLGK